MTLMCLFNSNLNALFLRHNKTLKHNQITTPFVIIGIGFAYYWDWGPNSGANWLVSSNSDGTNRGIESDNVETGSTNYTMCLNQVQLCQDIFTHC